jgi:hypothetical protein
MGKKFKHLELPGAAKNADAINAPGPIKQSTP